MADPNRYTQLLAHVFEQHYHSGATEVPFSRQALEDAAKILGIKLPKNLGDIIYSFRYRASLPEAITSRAPKDQSWVILPAGISRYVFMPTPLAEIKPNAGLSEVKIPDATPGVISRYALTDEQALLAKLRYNRMIDIFTGLTTYPLQSHLRTTVKGLGQVETDEVYVGLNRSGAHFLVPIQAKHKGDSLSIVQVWQDWMMAKEKFPNLICRPVAAQFMDSEVIALFEFEEAETLLRIRSEKHYRLVAKDELSPEEIQRYKQAAERD